MPFGDSDKNKILRRQPAILSVVILLVGITMCVLPGLQIIEPEKIRMDASRLETAEYFCNHISLPEQFFFVEKSSFIGAFKAEVFYKYKTERSSEEIVPFFAVWFSANNWERIDTKALTFRRNKYVISIENADFPHYNYVISCVETN